MDRAAPDAAASIACRPCCACRSGLCVGCAARPGAARGPAISRSGAAILTASTVSTPTTAAGARKTPISSCACCMPGVRRKDGIFATGVLHLWHPEADRSHVGGNERQAVRHRRQRSHPRATRSVGASSRRRARRLSAMTAMAQPGLFDRARLLRAADWLAVAAAASLPWSTSATGILVVLWLIVLLPAIDWRRLAAERWTAASGLPVAARRARRRRHGLGRRDVLPSVAKASSSFLKLLADPACCLCNSVARSGAGSCSTAISLRAPFCWPRPTRCACCRAGSPLIYFGVPVKNGATQSGEFVTCIFGLRSGRSMPRSSAGNGRWLFASAAAAAVHARPILFSWRPAARRYAVALVLLVVFAVTQLRPMSAVTLFVIAGSALAGAWFSSPYLRARTTQIWTDYQKYEASDERNSSGERIEFWKKSIEFIREAPLIGHGTGTIPSLFAKSAAGKTGTAGSATTNPHNQTFAVGDPAWPRRRRRAVGHVDCASAAFPRRRPGGLDRPCHRRSEHHRFGVQFASLRFQPGLGLRHRRRRRRRHCAQAARRKSRHGHNESHRSSCSAAHSRHRVAPAWRCAVDNTIDPQPAPRLAGRVDRCIGIRRHGGHSAR